MGIPSKSVSFAGWLPLVKASLTTKDNNNENKDKNPQRSQRQNSLCCMEVKTISGIRASLSSVPSCCSYLDKGKTKLSQPFSVLFGGSIYKCAMDNHRHENPCKYLLCKGFNCLLFMLYVLSEFPISTTFST